MDNGEDSKITQTRTLRSQTSNRGWMMADLSIMYQDEKIEGLHMEILVLRFYGYIGYFGDMSMNILEKISKNLKFIKTHENVKKKKKKIS